MTDDTSALAERLEYVNLGDAIAVRREAAAMIRAQAKALAELEAEVERLAREKAEWLDNYKHAAATIKTLGTDFDAMETRAEAAEAKLATAQQRLQAWQECALYDATMGGPVFKGWDRSALDRCRLEAEALAAHAGEEGRTP